jgi:hypothetical protein
LLEPFSKDVLKIEIHLNRFILFSILLDLSNNLQFNLMKAFLSKMFFASWKNLGCIWLILRYLPKWTFWRTNILLNTVKMQKSAIIHAKTNCQKWHIYLSETIILSKKLEKRKLFYFATIKANRVLKYFWRVLCKTIRLTKQHSMVFQP